MKLLLSSTITLAILSVATSTSTEESELVTTDCNYYNSRRDYNHRRRHNKNKWGKRYDGWWDDDAAEGTVGAKDNKGALALFGYLLHRSKTLYLFFTLNTALTKTLVQCLVGRIATLLTLI
jgi:hypothetical protein